MSNVYLRTMPAADVLSTGSLGIGLPLQTMFLEVQCGELGGKVRMPVGGTTPISKIMRKR